MEHGALWCQKDNFGQKIKKAAPAGIVIAEWAAYSSSFLREQTKLNSSSVNHDGDRPTS